MNPSKWTPPIRAPQQLGPARIEPTPLESTARDINEPGAPIVITPVGVDHVERLAAIGASDTAIAGALRIARDTFRHCKRRQPEVSEALARGRATLATECTSHLLIAARQGDWQAAAALGKFRLGWGGHAISSQQGEDMPEPDEKQGIDWTKVPTEECRFLLLAANRLAELQGGPPLTDAERAELQCHTALHLTPHERRQLMAGKTGDNEGDPQ